MSVSTDAGPARRAYRLGKRAQTVAQTRVRIIDAATYLFSQPSPSSVSVDEVARRAEVSRATIYHQFGSRRGLLDAVVEARLSDLDLPALQHLRELPNAREALTRYVEGCAHFWARIWPLAGNLAALAAIDEDASGTFSFFDNVRNEAMQRLALRLHEQGALREWLDAPTAANTLWWLTSIGTFTQLYRDSRLPVDDVARILNGMLTAILRDPA